MKNMCINNTAHLNDCIIKISVCLKVMLEKVSSLNKRQHSSDIHGLMSKDQHRKKKKAVTPALNMWAEIHCNYVYKRLETEGTGSAWSRIT